MKILGIDPALVNTGLALLNHTNDKSSIIDLGLIVTASSKDKKIRKNIDDYNRGVYLYTQLQPWIEKCDCVCVELPQIAGANVQARSMWSSGIALGIISSITKPIVLLSPAEVKLITGSKTASKEEVIAWATALYPDAPWKKVKRKGELVLVEKNEHIADAVAAAHAGLTKALAFLQKT